VLLATAAVLGLAMAAPAARYLSGWAAPGELRYLIPFNGAIGLSQSPLSPNGRDAISPDGTMLAFFARPTSSTVSPSSLALHVSQVGALTHEPFPGSEGGSQPFWSADGLSIGYVAGDRIWKVDASGGPPQDVAEAQGFMGGAWNSGGTILFGSATGIFRVPAEGGTPEPVTTPGDSETGHFWPRFLPDGQRFLYLAWSSDASARAVFVGSLDGTPAVRVMPAESNAIYTRSETSGRGYLVFHRGPIVYAQPFDADSLTLSGEPGRLADDIDHNPATGRGQFDVSATGVLAYYFDDLGAGRFSSTGADSWQWLAVWADMSTGQVVAPVGWEGMIRGVEVSPDGTRVAMHRHEEKGGDLWVIEPNGTRRHITFDLAEDASGPIWSPTGDDLVYSAYRNGQWGLYRTRSDGSGVAELLCASDLRKVPTSWSRDGRIVFWQEDPETAGDLWMLTVPATPQGTGGAAALELEPQPILKSPADERYGQVSPDGRWLAYVSDEIERGMFHVYVRPFPSGSGLYQISTLAQPGDRPRWSRDGRTLFFMEAMPSGATLRSATLFASAMGANRDALVYEPPRPVLGFTSFNLEHPGGPYPAYDVSPDPARMLVFQRYFADATAPSTTAAPVLGVDTQSGLVIARHWDSANEN
jgi:Tol biopolymer transport system component